MKRIVFIIFISIVAFTRGLFGKEKPNIIFILIDDMGYGDLKCYGSKVNETPNIDKLANEGIRFTQFYVNAPISSPSRVAFTTGQYPGRWGITSFINDRKSNKERGMKDYLDVNAPSLARNLHDAGYYTAHIGKWHMGGGRDIGEVPFITEYGFDESVTQFEGIGERYLSVYETLNLRDSTRNLEKMSAALGKGEIHWIKREDATKTYVDRAIKAIENSFAAGKPFYINLWPDDVHTPLEPPRSLRGNGSIPDLYKGVIKEMDTQFGRLFDYIRTNPKLKDNTLIILASDNGPEDHVGSASNLRGHKGQLYEGGIREPFIVWSPAYISSKKQGTVNAKTVMAAMDLPLSIIKIAGAKKTKGIKYDGVDMSEVFLGDIEPLRRTPIMWQRPPGTSLQDPDLAIRKGDYKLLIKLDGSNAQLYHISVDNEEKMNLSEQYPKLTNKLKNKVLEWYSDMTPLVK